MDFESRLRRITDLFVEGTGLYLGDGPDGVPILVWVNKLNSFQTEEARRDGASRRGMRLAELGSNDTPERAAVNTEIAVWSDDQLRQRWVDVQAEEMYLDALNDIEAEEEWREKLDMIRRLPTLLQEADAAPDDPRRQELASLQTAYFQAIADEQQRKQASKLGEAKGMSREQLTKEFIERWRQRLSLDEFMEERRVTELYYALRDCQATRDGKGFDHTPCDHSQRALEQRSDVRGLPEAVLEKCIEALDNMNVPQREAGNSDAPASSSASSEQPSTQEDSKPSTQDATSPAPPTS